MSNTVKSIAAALAIATGLLTIPVSEASARGPKIVVIEGDRDHHHGRHFRDRHHRHDRYSERRERRLERLRHERRHHRHRGDVVIRIR